MEFLLGQMDVDMKVNISMIRKKVMVTSIGQMAESTREDGKMVNNTVLVLILQLVVKLNKVNGMTVDLTKLWERSHSSVRRRAGLR